MARLHLVLAAVLLALAVPPASAQLWTGMAGDGNWNNPNNWIPSTVPNSVSAAPTFSNEGSSVINISSSVQAGSLNFSGVGGADFTLTSNFGQTLSGLTAINLPNSTGTDFGTQTIDLAYQAGGNLLYGGGPLTITNNDPYGLLISPNTVIGTPNAGYGVVIAGTGRTYLSGSFASGDNPVYGGLTKTGPGQLYFSGDATQLHGGLTLNGGTLTLDYSTNAATKIGGGPLTLSGGVLQMYTNGTAVTDSASGTTLAANHTEISAYGPVSNNFITLNMGAITRSPGATVDFSSNGPTFVEQTNTGNTNGLLGTGPAYATTGLGATWAINAGGYINGLPDSSYGADSYNPGTNTDYVSPNQVLSANVTTNSIRFNNNNGQINLLNLDGGNLTLQSGGILMTAQSEYVFISGQTGRETLIAGGAGELLVHQYNTSNTLTIDANIVAFGGLTKTGPGTLVLGGNNNLGTINVNQGNLTVTNAAAVNSAVSMNLNDNVQANGGQYLTFDLGNFVNGTVSTNIRLGTPTYGSAFSTGFSTNSIVTLSGVISSVPGMSTPVYFGLTILGGEQAITSGINVTGANTFLGAVYLYGGTLGINSNPSLGNAANTLYLAAGSSTAGGLVFLNGGVNLVRPVEMVGGSYNETRIVSNGSDVNSISGVISDYPSVYYGGARLYKAGTGTLILSATNTYSEGTEIDNGTLSVGADANLGAALTSVFINAGGTLGISSSFTTARPLLLGPAPATGASGPSNINVAAGQTFTPTGGISDNVGAGILGLTGPGMVALNMPNTYSGGTLVQQGTLLVSADANLGAASGPVTVNQFGTLIYTASDSTNRTFTLNSGTLSVAAGQTLTLNGAAIGGGFLTGPGAFAVTGGTQVTGATTFASTPINVTGAGSFTNFTNGGPLIVAGGMTGIGLTRFTNEGSGSITIGAASVVNVSDFQSYGLVTLNPAVVGSNQQTILTSTGSSPMYFNGGSRTFIGTPGTANTGTPPVPAFVSGIDLEGKNLVIADGLFVNNGFVSDYGNGASGSIIVDYGALYKGAGFTGVNIITQNGGKVQAGNSPGSASYGKFVFGPGGVNNYVFAIDDATGTAGPSPDTAGHVSGWGLINTVAQAGASYSGNFTWTATPTDKLTFAIDTLVNPTTVGIDVAGPMADFDPNSAYSWPAVRWTGAYSGPNDPSTLDAATAFNTSGVVNPFAGTFGWSLDVGNQTLSLTYTPSAVPEPGTLALTGLVAIVWLHYWRRQRSLEPTAA